MSRELGFRDRVEALRFDDIDSCTRLEREPGMSLQLGIFLNIFYVTRIDKCWYFIGAC